MRPSAIKRYAPTALFVVACLIFASFALGPEIFGHGKTKDYPLWFWVGRQALHGADIYAPNANGAFRFLYPPFAAALIAPLSLLGKAPMYACLTIANIAAWGATVMLSARLCGGASDQPAWVRIAPSLLLAPFIFDIFDLGQPNLALLATTLGGFALLRGGRPIGAGALFGLAAAIKAFPLAVFPWLVWRRQWRAAVATLAFLSVFLVLAPAPVLGLRHNLVELSEWGHGMLLSGGEQGFGQRPQQNWSWKNQSLIAVGNRLLRPINAEDAGRLPIEINLFDTSFRTANAIVAGLAMVIGLVFLALTPSPARRTDASDASEWGVLAILTTIASPLARQYYFVWLLYPVTVLVRRAASDPGGRASLITWSALTASFALMALSLPWPYSHWVQAAGNNLLAAAILIGALVWWMRRDQAPVTALAHPGRPGRPPWRSGASARRAASVK